MIPTVRDDTPGPINWLRMGGHDVRNLTQEARIALVAIAWCFDLYTADEVEGQEAALSAVRNLLNALDRRVWPLARELIVRSQDEATRDILWPRIDVGGLYARGEGEGLAPHYETTPTGRRSGDGLCRFVDCGDRRCELVSGHDGSHAYRYAGEWQRGTNWAEPSP